MRFDQASRRVDHFRDGFVVASLLCRMNVVAVSTVFVGLVYENKPV